jgi:hypothetical protein
MRLGRGDSRLIHEPDPGAFVGDPPALFVIEYQHRVLSSRPRFPVRIEPQIRGHAIADQDAVAVEAKASALLQSGQDVKFDCHRGFPPLLQPAKCLTYK